MKFKSPELTTEFSGAHPRVIALALYLDRWFVEHTGHDGMVTDVSRTQAEYDQIYGGHPYTGPMPHLGPMSHAVDWRSRDFTMEQIDAACAEMNKWWPRHDGKPTLMCHTVGGGAFHFHLQAEV